MQEGQNVRQQVVERIRQSTSILVAVGNNPSVDALAAALGLSLMLNKMNKHTTAVFSGQTPAAIQFLEPNKTFENSVDALRDFIISLDKEKADRLRYKVEDDVVRIFITPYKTSITEKDLQFSQGDFNVDLIIALGVEKREELDKAIVAHGRILHDATVVTVNADNQRSTLGAIDYNDSAASSLCEMLVGMSESFQQPGLLDAQISTALLTGIVAATDRFSNPKTSPRVMTMAAQLMAAGANQQLIATNLEKARTIAPSQPAEPAAGPMAKQSPSAAPKPIQQESPKKEPGELDIAHEPTTPLAMPSQPPAASAPEPAAGPTAAEKELEAALPLPEVQHNLLPELKNDLETAAKNESNESPAPGSHSVNVDEPKQTAAAPPAEEYISSHGSWKGKRLEPPTLGGTLNATTEEAMEATKKAEEADRNKTLLSHPADAAPSKSKRKRNRGGKNKDTAEATAPVVAATPALLAEPALAPLPPAPEPVEQPPIVAVPPTPPAAPVPEPAPAPAPQPPTPQPEPPVLPPEPAPELAPAPPEPTAPAPQQAVPVIAPAAPEPTPLAPTPPQPETQPEPAPSLDSLQQAAASSAAEAAASAQPAQTAAGDLDSARQAVSDALQSQPFDPSSQPMQSVGAQPMPAMPDVPVAEPLPPQTLQTLPPAPEPATTPQPADLPPMPPMPPLPTSGTDLPPAPDLPGLNAPLPPIGAPTPTPLEPTPPAPQTPQQPPAVPPADPGQFKIPGA